MTSTPKYLFQLPFTELEPMNVGMTFDSFDSYLKFFGGNISTRDNIISETLMYWRWVPSFKKATEHKLENVLGFFDHLDKDDEYKYGTNGKPHDDKSNHLVYKDHDYLLIYTQRLNNGFHENSYKITVTDTDEPKVRELIKHMINSTKKTLLFDEV